ncbi:MAG: response regulator [candidate division Zixibacteria bacterium]|jgi:two-component system response regulator (stage 0 sporulation protein F)|nr:response regulator [candidate division Zixibacteria bacterium]NIR64510.1 response regulator [candidate division Zixibacteria bacterium]NIS16579.1 response regulator [candidate division Zixibacteria bacterium]NIS46287.1 response regulator [candidate division Zixibacteria bacterium]NIT52941.1 response regulator [candidate division Zixibacteria bacterium]
MSGIKKILVVDDTPVIRRLLCDVLESEGYEIEEAIDGVEALEKIRASKFDLVFCDIHMPRKNGFDTYIAAREIDPNLDFIMTDSFPDKLAEKTNEMGALCCLAKPFELDELRKTLKQAEQLKKSKCPIK